MLLWLAACSSAPAPVPPFGFDGLWIEQVELRGPSIGEATLVHGPDATVLIDVGNDAHTEAVVEAVDRVSGGLHVDHVVLTHFHADHIGGMDDLAQHLSIGRIVSRGPIDLDGDVNLGEWEQIEALDIPRDDLCTQQGCAAHVIDLGGPQLRILGANGFVGDQRVVDPAGEENARSLVGDVRWGAFGYVFAGDLTGGGKDTVDAESAFAPFVQPADVVHVSHHGIQSSSNDAWLDAVVPADGQQRHALVGANSGYLDAPAAEVLDRFEAHLGGGAVHAPRTGSLVGRHDALCVMRTGPVVRVEAGGASFDLVGACSR